MLKTEDEIRKAIPRVMLKMTTAAEPLKSVLFGYLSGLMWVIGDAPESTLEGLLTESKWDDAKENK